MCSARRTRRKHHRELARRWTEGNLADLELNRIEALHGEIMVNRAAGEMLSRPTRR